MRLTISPPPRAECHEIWEPKPPGTLWATPGLLQDFFTFTVQFKHAVCKTRLAIFLCPVPRGYSDTSAQLPLPWTCRPAIFCHPAVDRLLLLMAFISCFSKVTRSTITILFFLILNSTQVEGRQTNTVFNCLEQTYKAERDLENWELF